LNFLKKGRLNVSDGLDLLEQRVQLLFVIVAGIAWQNWGFI